MDLTKKLLRALHKAPSNPNKVAYIKFSHTDISYQVWELRLRVTGNKLYITRLKPLPELKLGFDLDGLDNARGQDIHPNLNLTLLQENLPLWMRTNPITSTVMRSTD